MTKGTSVKLKIAIAWIALVVGFMPFSGYSQAMVTDLQRADSLFAKGSYSQAFQVYEALFHQHRLVSPAMLLKMAFIQERIENYPETIYYLHQHHRLTGDNEVRSKIQGIASAFDLEGYEQTDFQYLMSSIYANLPYIRAGLLIWVAIWMAFVLWIRIKRKRRPVLSAALMLVWVFFAYQALHAEYFQQGIIREDSTLLMDGPSSAANALGTLTKGHQITVLEREDVWWKVEWKGEEGYIKQQQLMLLLEEI